MKIYYDDALLNLSVAYRYRISAVPKLTIVAPHKLNQQIPKLHPQFEPSIEEYMNTKLNNLNTKPGSGHDEITSVLKMNFLLL